MKIAIFTDTFVPTSNGIVTSTVQFCKTLSDLWHKVLVICPYILGVENFSYPWVTVISVHWLPSVFYPEFRLIWMLPPKVKNALQEFNADVVHIHTQFCLGYFGIQYAHKNKLPLVASFHTYIADREYLKILNLDKFTVIENIARKYNNYFYKDADVIVCPSQNSLKLLESSWIQHQHIFEVSNPMPLPSGKEVQHHYLDWVENKNILLYVGRISKEKWLDKLLETIVHLQNKTKDFLLVIVGDGPYKEELTKIIQKHKLENNIVLLGNIPHEKLLTSDIFHKSKIFISCSVSETQGITLIEAMYFWLPLIWFDQKWVGELIEHNINWLKHSDNIEQLADFCNELFHNSDLYNQLSKWSQETCQKYHPLKCTKKLLEVYQIAITTKK